MKKKVYMAEVIHPDAEKKLREYADVVDNFDHIEELDAIFLRAHHLNRDQISRAKKCKVIARHGVGMDILDVQACREFGIPITYTPGANTYSVAEFAFTMSLALMRNLYQTEYIQKTQGFKEMGPVSLRGNELRGKVIGIVGASGRIGSTLASMYLGFGCKVLGYTVHTTAEELAKKGVTRISTIEEMVAQSDIVSINCPLLEETRGMFNAEMFSHFKPGSILINTARGPIVDEEALYEALTNGTLRACGSDVFCDEAHSFDSPLNKLDNFIGFPHVAANTHESMYNMAMWAVDDLIAVLEGREPKYLYEG